MMTATAEWPDEEPTQPPRDEADHVDPALGCPRCGELHTDFLVWLDDYETVRCETCGMKYKPADNAEA